MRYWIAPSAATVGAGRGAGASLLELAACGGVAAGVGSTFVTGTGGSAGAVIVPGALAGGGGGALVGT